MSKTDRIYTHLANKAYDRPCAICGATHRTTTGQDPCIQELPGVLHACCGHGYGPGYVMFENCVTMRGYFELNRPDAEITKALNEEFLR